MTTLAWTEMLIRLALAAVLGASVGLERERKERAAGLRTHMMVCIGSALAMLVSTYGFNDVQGVPNVSLDPSRVAAQVISGIGFIGGGTILFLRQNIVKGLTTASGLWTVAAIGLAAGGGMYLAAFVTTLFAIFILWMLHPVERKFSRRFQTKAIRLTVDDKAKSAEVVNKIIQNDNLDVQSCNVDRHDSNYIISFKFKNLDKKELKAMIGEFQSDAGIKEINWNK
ncbi:MAG: MgtC/SapB family protein [Ignavibacteria bacterium]|nr:MgtC/SapB family protein [Ignavibacteria bacterium]